MFEIVVPIILVSVVIYDFFTAFSIKKNTLN